MIDLAATEKPVVTNIQDYDNDPWLFNCANGTLNLRTAEFRSHRCEDMMTKISPVVYDPGAACPTFERFIHWAHGGDQQMIDFLARAAGYSLTGDTGIQALFFNHGDGANGKGTFTELLRFILGDYGRDTSFTTFVNDKNKSEHRNDIAALRGARFVTASESSDGHYLDEELIKKITGCDPITVRELYGKPFTFLPAMKLWFQSNYQPTIKGQDWGIWRRVKMIPWEQIVDLDKADDKLPAKLRAESSGVLNWMLSGLKTYLEFGMMYPEKVEAATQQYRDAMDIIGRFVGTCCAIKESATAVGSEVYAGYVGWCKANGEFPMKRRKFDAELRKKYPLKSEHSRVGVVWGGVGLLREGRYPEAADIDCM